MNIDGNDGYEMWHMSRADDDGMRMPSVRHYVRRDKEARQAFEDLQTLSNTYGLDERELKRDFLGMGFRELYASIISGFRNQYPGKALDTEAFVVYSAGQIAKWKDKIDQEEDKRHQNEIARMEGGE